MKTSIKHHAVALASLALLTATSHATVLAAYNFAGSTAAIAAVASTTTTGVTAGNFTAVGGNANFSTAAGNVFLRSQFTGATQADALADTDYFSVTISATNPGDKLDLTSLTLRLGSTERLNPGTFINQVYLQSSVGGFGSGNPIIAGTNTTFSHNGVSVPSDQFNPLTTSFDLSGSQFQGLTSMTFQFRFSDDADNNDQINRMDDVILNGAVVIPEPSTALLGGLGLLALLRRRRN